MGQNHGFESDTRRFFDFIKRGAGWGWVIQIVKIQGNGHTVNIVGRDSKAKSIPIRVVGAVFSIFLGLEMAIVASGAGFPRGMTALCTDGSYSASIRRPGTCAWHGGVKEWRFSASNLFWMQPAAARTLAVSIR